MMATRRIIVIGGGAAGFFAAITAAETNPAAVVELWEATAQPLAKVRVSGGGRCNVTHACFEPRELVKHYPRGGQELLGLLHTFGPRETVAWFAARGVTLKTEGDGRMFPVTDDSATIVACLREAAARAGVRVRERTAVSGLVRRDETGRARARMADCHLMGDTWAEADAGGGWVVSGGEGMAEEWDAVVLATGGARGAGRVPLAAGLGHTIEAPVPSLFTFKIEDARLAGLAGLSVPCAATQVLGTKLRETGPVLVTHWGLSGPGILKLSAWGARELAAQDYRFEVGVNWRGEMRVEEVRARLAGLRTSAARRQVAGAGPEGVPARLWERLAAAAGTPAGATWSGVSNELIQALTTQVAAGVFAVSGQSTNKEEFVTCGGVRLREVDFRRMESRLAPGLFLAGEVLDIDGVTGGFNFQAAWTTGFLAGRAAAGG